MIYPIRNTLPPGGVGYRLGRFTRGSQYPAGISNGIYFFGKNTGFTLIELLIYVAIIGGVAITFVAYILSVSQARNKIFAASETQGNGRVALAIISQRIRLASAVSVVNSGRLSLFMSDGTNMIIDLSPTSALQITESGVPPIIFKVTSDKVKVSNLVFTDLSGFNGRKNIGLELTVDYDSGLSGVAFAYSQTLRTSVGVRQ